MLNTTDKFKREIQKANVQLYPVVIIDPDTDPIRLSTNSFTKEGEYYAPLILNVNGLRESISLRHYNHKVGKVTIWITDREFENVKFTDRVAGIGLSSSHGYMINRRISIYITNDNLSWEDSPLVFDGICSNYSQKELTLQVVVETRELIGNAQKWPNELLINQDLLFDRDKGKYSPIYIGGRRGGLTKEVFLYKTINENSASADYLESDYQYYASYNTVLMEMVLSNAGYAIMKIQDGPEGGIHTYEKGMKYTIYDDQYG